MALGQPLLVALGAALVAALAAIAYWRSRRPKRRATGVAPDATADPGLTTELALFVTYLVGVLCVQQPALGAAAAATVAVLLALRERLHRLAAHVLSEGELHDALLLAALVLVLLPLAPADPWPWLGGASARTLLLTTVLILAVQGAGHVALRVFGARGGLLLAGLLSGFVSSTATMAAMAGRASAEPHQARACLAGALASSFATWAQWCVLVAALAASALPRLLPVAAAGAAAALLATGWAWRHAVAGVGAARDAANNLSADTDRRRGPLRLRTAVVVAMLLTAVAALVGIAERHWGAEAVLSGAALAGLADAHAPVAALAAQYGGGRLDAEALALGALLAIGSNSLTRSATAMAAGGTRFGAAVAAALSLQLVAAGGAWSMLG
jgi:uncharacterized membrane protein (DUF4010 family)